MCPPQMTAAICFFLFFRVFLFGVFALATKCQARSGGTAAQSVRVQMHGSSADCRGLNVTLWSIDSRSLSFFLVFLSLPNAQQQLQLPSDVPDTRERRSWSWTAAAGETGSSGQQARVLQLDPSAGRQSVSPVSSTSPPVLRVPPLVLRFVG